MATTPGLLRSTGVVILLRKKTDFKNAFIKQLNITVNLQKV